MPNAFSEGDIRATVSVSIDRCNSGSMGKDSQSAEDVRLNMAEISAVATVSALTSQLKRLTLLTEEEQVALKGYLDKISYKVNDHFVRRSTKKE